MLAPNAMEVGDLLAQSYSTVLMLDGFTYSAMNTRIGYLSPDPGWLESVRSRFAMLSGVSTQWQSEKPNIWANILRPFERYSASFKGFTDISKELGNDPTAWIEALRELRKELIICKEATESSQKQFKPIYSNIKNVEQLFESSLNEGWKQLGSQEKKMIILAGEITHLDDQLTSLQSKLDWASISGAKGIVQNALTINYTILSTAGQSVPYLTAVTMLFTTGKMLYDILGTGNEIFSTIERIAKARLEMTEEAQAAAMSKAVIQLINNMDKSLLSIRSTLPRLSSIWKTEEGKMSNAIHALEAGVKPSDFFELRTMPIAAKTWQGIADQISFLIETLPQGIPVPLDIPPKEKPSKLTGV